jgi:hypothetical protein
LAAPAHGVAGFGDVGTNDYWAEPVQWMVDHDLTAGVSAGCVAPGEAVTRGQAAAFMWRMEGKQTVAAAHSFVDVNASWQQDAVAWMLDRGITTGVSV